MKAWKRPLVVVVFWSAAFIFGYGGYELFQNQQFAQAQERREEIRRNLGQVDALAKAYRDVGKVVGPSVVNINVRKRMAGFHRMPFDEDMLRRFFRDRGLNEDDLPEGLIPPQRGPDDEEGMPEALGTGSGVIIEVNGSKGYVVTNNHVAGGAEEMVVTLADGRQVRNAKLLGTDAKTDLAVIEIQADRLVPAKWGNSEELQQGDLIVAFGSPFGYVGSMTHGIVSALNRQAGILGNGGYEDFIQVDAPINPGNSGGPLVNMHGEVVGINTAIASRSGGFQGIGFAIPSNMAKNIITALREKGKVTRGWLGVGISDVSKSQQLAKSFGYEGEQGVLVEQVIPGTPATGKLRAGDIILEVNNRKVDDVQQLRYQVANLPPGREVPMKIFRGGKTETVSVTLGEQPENVASVRGGRGEGERGPDAGSAESLGIQVQTLNNEMAERLGLDVKNGAVVTRVNRNSPAAREGIRVGDVITEAGNKKINSADDLVSALKNADLKKGVRLYVTNQAGSRFVFIQTEK